MHIFIDESGVFIRSQSLDWSVSCVGALVIPDDELDNLSNEFIEYKRDKWDIESGEVKGRELDENQFSEFVNFLRRYDLLFEVAAIDLQTQADDRITQHKMTQAAKIVERLDERFHRSLISEAQRMKKYLEQLSNPLYVQAVLTFELIYKVVQKSTMYYVQTNPKELGQFVWTVDAKDRDLTGFEKFWRIAILPIAQTKSLEEPLIIVKGWDYSYFHRFSKTVPKTPEHLRERIGVEKPFSYFDVGMILHDNLSFRPSHEVLGLQMADILVTNIRRAMNGNLQEHGWQGVGELMVESKVRKQVITFVDMCFGKRPIERVTKPPYYKVVKVVEGKAKQMIRDSG